jgi:hypothetical protein
MSTTVNVRGNFGSAGNTVMEIICTGTVGASPIGSLHVQTLTGIFEGTLTQLVVFPEGDGLHAVGTALGYFQQTGVSSLRQSQAAIGIVGTPSGTPGQAAVVLMDHNTGTPFFTSNMQALQANGHAAITGQ